MKYAPSALANVIPTEIIAFMRLPRTLLKVLRTAALVYFGLLLVIGFLQRQIIYFPRRGTEAVLLGHARGLGVEPWRDGEGRLIGWKTPTPPGIPPAANRLIVFHGNAGYALHRTHFIERFGALDGGRTWEVFVFEYPGYGARPGPLGEEPFTLAARAAFDELAARDPRPIHLLGESLGSGLASALAAAVPERVAGIFLITPFTRLADVAAHHYPWLPVRLILLDRWDNLSALQKYRGPLAVMLAAEDEVIPVALGHRLFDTAAEPKRLWLQPGTTHNGLDFSASAAWWREVSDFLTSNARRDRRS